MINICIKTNNHKLFPITIYGLPWNWLANGKGVWQSIVLFRAEKNVWLFRQTTLHILTIIIRRRHQRILTQMVWLNHLESQVYKPCCPIPWTKQVASVSQPWEEKQGQIKYSLKAFWNGGLSLYERTIWIIEFCEVYHQNTKSIDKLLLLSKTILASEIVTKYRLRHLWKYTVEKTLIHIHINWIKFGSGYLDLLCLLHWFSVTIPMEGHLCPQPKFFL